MGNKIVMVKEKEQKDGESNKDAESEKDGASGKDGESGKDGKSKKNEETKREQDSGVVLPVHTRNFGRNESWEWELKVFAIIIAIVVIMVSVYYHCLIHFFGGNVESTRQQKAPQEKIEQ